MAQRQWQNLFAPGASRFEGTALTLRKVTVETVDRVFSLLVALIGDRRDASGSSRSVVLFRAERSTT